MSTLESQGARGLVNSTNYIFFRPNGIVILKSEVILADPKRQGFSCSCACDPPSTPRALNARRLLHTDHALRTEPTASCNS